MRVATGMAPPRTVAGMLVGPVRDFTDPLRPQLGRGYATPAQGSDYVGESEAAGLESVRSVTHSFHLVVQLVGYVTPNY